MKFKKSIIITATATILMGLATPVLSSAEDIDNKIANEEQKINDLNAKKASTEMTLADLESRINSLTSESESLLKEKNELEQEVNQLALDIQDLEEKIAKRNDQIDEQARSTQINQDKQDIVNVLLDSESISDAIGRTVAYTKLVSANNDIMQAQKDDQEALTKKKASLEEKVAEITEKAAVLKEKQAELETSKSEQVKLANEILKNLESAKSKKSEYESQKAEAERIAAEQAKIAKENAEKEKAAKAAAAAAQKAAEEKLESEQPVSLSKNTGDKGTTDNSQSDSGSVSASGFQMPLAGGFTVTSGFGSREDPTGYAGTYHDGIDLATSAGTTIMAARAGKVVESQYHYSAGNYVIIEHDNGYYTYYMHMMQPGIAVGSTVSAGDAIGYVGTTGSSTGNHLHFGIATGIWSGFMNPAPFIGL